MSTSGPEKKLQFSFHHTMLPVADLDRSVRFYTILMGMTLAERHASAARNVEVGLVGYGDTVSAPFLELTQKTGEDAPKQVMPLPNHIAIDVNDLRSLARILEEENITFHRPLKASNGAGGRRYTAWVLDPDGHQIEVIEREPSSV